MSLGDTGIRRLAAQISTIRDIEIRATYLRFALGFSALRGIWLRPDSHGYIENELRAYRADQWYFSAVLNEKWILFYLRWPAIRDKVYSADDFKAQFEDAEATKAKDVKLRVPNLELASGVITFLSDSRR